MIDFSKLARDKGVPFIQSGHHHVHEGWGQTHCPFCSNGTHGFHLGFNLNKGYFSCWRCGGKSVWNVLHALFPNESIKSLIEEYSDGVRQHASTKTRIRTRNARKPPHLKKGLGKFHQRYLIERNFDPKHLTKEWDLCSTGSASKDWKWRIIAPIRNTDHSIIGYTGRCLNNHKKPRWKVSNNKDLAEDPKKLLYGIEKVKDSVLIVEGVSDVWRMGPGSVALMGIDWTVEQASILRKIPKRFVMFDPETNAQMQADKLAKWLSPFPGETEIICGLSTDPGGLSPKEADNIAKELGIR